MNPKSRMLTVALAGLLAMVTGCDSRHGTGILTLDGARLAALPTAGSNVVVLVFVATQCPISNRYVPELKRLHERYSTNAGVNFFIVYPDPAAAEREIIQHVREYALPGKVLRDPRQELVRLAGARVTPEAAVFRRGELVYHGRIDDRFPAFGVDRGTATERTLDIVLQALLLGKETRLPESRPAVGCVIPPVD